MDIVEKMQSQIGDDVQHIFDHEALFKLAIEEIKRLRTLATDRSYKITALTNMLGPNGLAVVKNWDERGVTRIHFDWGPSAASLTGEERAAFILDMEKQFSVPVENIDTQ
jgi:hypothetical protein